MATLAGSPQLPAASRIAGYNRVLRARATLKDIYTNHTGLFKRTEMGMPNAIYMKVDEGQTRGTNNITITMKLPLTGAVVRGNRRLSGTEEDPNTVTAHVYRNQYKKAVKGEEYGVRYLDQVDYGLFQQHVRDLGAWAREYEGLEIRMAYLERYGHTLQDGDTQAVCVPEWTPHIFVQGAADLQQPAFDPNGVIYTNNIVNAILNANGGALTPQAQAHGITFRMLNKLAEMAMDEFIIPLQIGGQDAYILTISPRAAAMFTDPTWVTNNLGSQWTDYNRLSDKVQNWYGVIGKFMSSSGADIYIVVDPRCPTVLPSGSAEPFSLRAGYVWPGDVDLRNLANPATRDVYTLHGRAGICNWEPEKMHFVSQDDDYGRILGDGLAGVRGIMQVQYDSENPDATTREYYGSISVIAGRPVYQ